MSARIHIIQVKRFGSSKTSEWFKVRIFADVKPYHADTIIVYDRAEAVHFRNQLYLRQAELEAAWGNTELLDSIIAEAEHAGRQAYQLQAEGDQAASGPDE